MQGPAKVFVAYANADVKFRHELEMQLKLLNRKGYVIWFSEHELRPGDEKQAVLSEAINSADVILLLVSIHFLADDFSWGEQMELAVSRHDAGDAIVIPIIVRPCAWEDTPIDKLQGVPSHGKAISSWSDRHRAWTDVAHGLQSAVIRWRGQNSP